MWNVVPCHFKSDSEVKFNHVMFYMLLYSFLYLSELMACAEQSLKVVVVFRMWGEQFHVPYQGLSL